MQKVKILIVEDELILAMELEMRLQSKDFYNTKIVTKGEQAVKSAKSFQPDVILMDIMLPGVINGIEAAIQILAFKKIPIIYITGNDHLREDAKLLATNPVTILGKPLSAWELFESLDKALKNYHE
ncbi:response regulator [candidate division KSB1 bacterium]|nr:response regulator [candidate division KSB1 bacterium]MBL7095767.1 response regulator [candidate division KSB1 bacterium]